MNGALDQLVRLVDLPAVVLIVMLIGSAWIAWQAHHSGKFSWGNMLRDGEGKESAQRFAVLGAFAVSSWFLMKMALRDGPIDPQIVWAYLISWSGAHVLTKAAEKWDGRLPWAAPVVPGAPK